MLWAITSYFNPAGYATRLANFGEFRRRLTVPLVAVEASFDGRFALGPGDAEVLVQLRARDVLWQKERLLNVALTHLPPECEQVAWLDCDVVLSEDWPQRARDALGRHALVQLFSERSNEGRNGDASVAEAIGVRIAGGRAKAADLADPDAPLLRRTTAGLAWAADRDLLDRHGLYDACVLGTGDRAIVCAGLGELGYGERAVHMTPAHAEHYRAWAIPFADEVGGRVGAIEGRARHLFHGDLRRRRYGERLRVLNSHCFDPAADIAVDNGGCWRWSSPKPDLHDYASAYFRARAEDAP
jgi:hypothetical protein